MCVGPEKMPQAFEFSSVGVTRTTSLTDGQTQPWDGAQSKDSLSLSFVAVLQYKYELVLPVTAEGVARKISHYKKTAPSTVGTNI